MRYQEAFGTASSVLPGLNAIGPNSGRARVKIGRAVLRKVFSEGFWTILCIGFLSLCEVARVMWPRFSNAEIEMENNLLGSTDSAIGAAFGSQSR